MTSYMNCHLICGQHIVRGSKKPRLKSKLYIFNSFGMLGTYIGTELDLDSNDGQGVYVVITIMNFVL